jgi:hypothetical protein
MDDLSSYKIQAALGVTYIKDLRQVPGVPQIQAAFQGEIVGTHII